MVTRREWIGLGMAALMSARLSAAAAEEKDGGDLKKLQGKWTTPSGQGGDPVKYTFKGNKLKIEAPSRTYEMTVTLDATAKPEKSIDFRIDEGPDDARGNTSKGIYKFDGNDRFIFCFRPAGDRPDRYEQVGYEQIVTELKRAKE